MFCVFYINSAYIIIITNLVILYQFLSLFPLFVVFAFFVVVVVGFLYLYNHLFVLMSVCCGSFC